MLKFFKYLVFAGLLKTSTINAQTTYSLQYAKAIENEVVSFVQEDSYI